HVPQQRRARSYRIARVPGSSLGLGDLAVWAGNAWYIAAMLAQSVHAHHRQEFMAAMGPNSAALIGSPPEALRNGDAHYSYRQSSDLYYLSGFAEPEATIVLRPGAAEPYVLFVRPKDPEREIWDGRRAGTEGALAQFGADK